MKYGSLEKMCLISLEIKKLRRKQSYIKNKYMIPATENLYTSLDIERMKDYCELWLSFEKKIQLLIESKSQIKNDN